MNMGFFTTKKELKQLTKDRENNKGEYEEKVQVMDTVEDIENDVYRRISTYTTSSTSPVQGVVSTGTSSTTYTNSLPPIQANPSLWTQTQLTSIPMMQNPQYKYIPGNPYEMNKSLKSDFEVLLDTMFTYQEKKEFLSSLGYRSTMGHGKKEITDGEPVWIPKYKEDDSLAYTGVYDSVNSAFLKEITIKFKNLLLAKPSLKIKI